MKLSFSLSSKPSSKPKHQQHDLKPSENFSSDGHDASASATTDKQFVTEFDPSKPLSSDQQKKLVIPPKPNEWRPLKKMKNLNLPLGSSDDGPNLQFEVVSDSIGNGEGSNMSYGLNLRNSPKDEGDTATVNSGSDERSRPASIETVMLQKFKEDMKRLPDPVFEDYEEMPVEGFGAALLAGYGWVEGRGIGRNAKEDVKIVEYKRWTAKEGLGFDPAVHSKKTEKQEDGEYNVGQEVRIIRGRDAGIKGKIVEKVGGGDSIVLRLSKSGEDVKVQTQDIAELGSAEEEKGLRKLTELKIWGSTDGVGADDGRRIKDSSNGRGYKESKEEEVRVDKRKHTKRSREEGRRRSDQSDQREEPRRSSSLSWLTSHIRVRIISKELKGGRLYLKKGEVVDVVGPTTCDISMDESREIIQGVDQDLLETALPRRGGPVLVLYGKHKGVYGSLVERDMENETGVIRDADSHALLKVRLEQIAEYIGDPECLGY